MATAHHSEESEGDTRRKRRLRDRDSSAGDTRRKRRLGDRDWRLRDVEWYQKRGTKAKPPTVAQSRDLLPPSSDDDRSAKVQAMVGEHVRRMLAVHAEKKRLVDEFNRSIFEESVLTVETRFGDINDGSTESLKARKVAMMITRSVVSLSSFSGKKRIRVCSGFMICWKNNSQRRMVITSATLIRSLNSDNVMVSDLTVKVLLPNGTITRGYVFLVDFHYNVAVVEIRSDLKLPDITLAKDIVDKGDVLAFGRSYEGGDIMCSRGTIMSRTSTLGCSDLLVSNCKISMAGVGGPLVDYNGHFLGINFYEENQTSFLSMAIVSRILEHHQRKTILPWLGLNYYALETVPLGVLERIYQKFPDVDKGLYISDHEYMRTEQNDNQVAPGSPADVAGLCAGDVLVRCNGEVISTTPQCYWIHVSNMQRPMIG
ncbi:hypothetical protein PR202_ga24028 [Eleusine coracana subsp. coracana]|uniref:PDZ domain-containing protein n=1 Tax=Eleusine coracana subsp. coracana TaxID=191504 RepID=A0AAV5D7G5_ELECO|nr:hypothetical protein PR202_ga24028 [Eleusine coracana subsp. coracana]